jgi:hypothetical protein
MPDALDRPAVSMDIWILRLCAMVVMVHASILCLGEGGAVGSLCVSDWEGGGTKNGFRDITWIEGCSYLLQHNKSIDIAPINARSKKIVAFIVPL